MLDLVPSKIRSGMSYISSNHVKGEEPKEIVASSFRIKSNIELEEIKIRDQIHLF